MFSEVLDIIIIGYYSDNTLKINFSYGVWKNDFPVVVNKT